MRLSVFTHDQFMVRRLTTPGQPEYCGYNPSVYVAVCNLDGSLISLQQLRTLGINVRDIIDVIIAKENELLRHFLPRHKGYLKIELLKYEEASTQSGHLNLEFRLRPL